jgi:hypothetical protein
MPRRGPRLHSHTDPDGQVNMGLKSGTSAYSFVMLH